MENVYIKNFDLPVPPESLPYNYEYHLTHYVFYPWVIEDEIMYRLFKVGKKLILVKVSFLKKPKPAFRVNLFSKSKITDADTQGINDTLSWIFAINDKVYEFYSKIVQHDPVLKAAGKEIFGAHLKRDPYVFESVIGVVVAQNVQFKRIYTMLENLVKTFGEKDSYFDNTYYTFPSPEALARAPLAKIRECKVGYRDKYIKGIAEKIVKDKLNLDDLRTLPDKNAIREALVKLPGVGPYTADLAIAIGFDLPSFHLDLFTREVLWIFYFKGKKVPDKKLSEFVEKKWGKWMHYAMLLLTTNTDIWARELGVEFRLKSAAKQS